MSRRTERHTGRLWDLVPWGAINFGKAPSATLWRTLERSAFVKTSFPPLVARCRAGACQRERAGSVIGIAAELAFSVWVSRRDAHNSNRVYVSGIPMFFDFDLALDGYQAPFFKGGSTSGYAPNWRLHLCDDPWTQIITAEFRELERGKPITLHPISSEEEFWRHFEAHIERIRHLDNSFIRERISAVIGDESLRNHYTDFVVRQKNRLADDAEQVKAVLRQPLSDLHKEIYEESRRKAKEAAISEAERVRRALAQAEATRHALESKIELLLSSNSWRVTAPLRAASRFLRRRGLPG